MNTTFHPALQLLEPTTQYTLMSAHSSYFQPLIHQLLTVLSAERVIPAMTAEEIRRVVYLSRFHDIGKQGLPKQILNKPGRLTLEERRMLQMHPILGVQLLRSNHALREYPHYELLYDICLHHHERWDGGGYPDGLKGSHIAPCVHVVSFADAYDALRTARPYKRPLSHGEAITMLCAGECGAFNPRMLDCLRDAFDDIFTPCYGEERKVG